MKVLLVVIAFVALSPVRNTDAFNVSLELQGDCSDQITLICRHSDISTDPNWLHNGTSKGGQFLSSAFPGATYSVQSDTEHRVTISGVGNVQSLDGYTIQCLYSIRGNDTKSNAVKYSFIPPDYQPTLSLVSVTADFSERFCNFTYSYQESCSLYPRCTPYFSVEHTVSPQSAVSNSSSGCGVEYTIHNLMRCVSYHSTATTLLPSQRGIPVVVGDTVMQSPGQFTIISVSIGVDRNLVNVTYMENESDCPNYPTERFTVVVDDKVQVANMTADDFQFLAINHANGSVTLPLPLSQPLPENAVKLNMTKYNTVPTNKSDVTGKMVTEMVPWGTSALFDLSQESSDATNDKGEVSVGVVVGAIISGTITITVLVALLAVAVVLLAVIALRQNAKKRGTVDIKPTAPVSVGDMGKEGSNALTEENAVSDGVVESPPSPAAGTADETLEVCEPKKGCHPVTESTKQPKVDRKGENPAGGVVPQETTCAFGDDTSTGHDYISDDGSPSMVSSGQNDPHERLDSRPGPSYPLEYAPVYTPSKTSEVEPKCSGREEWPTMEKERKPMGGVQPTSYQQFADNSQTLEDDHVATCSSLQEKGYVVPDKVVEPPTSPAAETVNETLEVCEPEEECHPTTES